MPEESRTDCSRIAAPARGVVRLTSGAVRFSIGLPTDRVELANEFVTGEAVMACAAEVERLGFDACFVTDHPAPDAKWLAGGGHHALDPMVALSFAAAATTRLRLQTHIMVLAYRNPLLDREVGAQPRRPLGRPRDPRGRCRAISSRSSRRSASTSTSATR